MKYKSLITALLIGSAVVLPGCKDEFAEVNTDQSVVTQPDIRYLFTQALQEFEPAKYQQWFYNNLQYTMPWVQATIYDGGNSSNLNVMGAYENASAQVVRVKTRVEEIDFLLSLMEPEEAATYDNIRALCNPLLVFLGIFGTDMYGSMPYSETGKGLVTDPPLLAPEYETQEELFDLWEKQLNETLTILGENRPNQVPLPGNQDFVYKNDLSKWARFTNSLKLKLAVRLIHVDKARALRLANEVATHSAGIMNSLEDDFFYCRGSQEYHFGDDLWHGRGGQNLINFLVDNKDPRVRFMFMKNDFNSKVVQALYDEGVSLPDFIEEKVNSTIVDGRKVFESWKSPGEPWVRYIGAPVDIYARDNGYYVQNYFNTDNFKIGDKKYNPLSLTHIEMIRGEYEYTFPDSPNVTAVKDTEKNAWWALFYSSAEVNFYLAELGLLGASLPNSPESYFEEGVRLSVLEHDRLGSLNKIPYYSSVYDPNETVIALQDGELEALLEQEGYQLTGTTLEKLEKVYIQQYIHFFINLPNDQFVAVRRSGVPMRNSKLLPWSDFTNNEASYYIPRRFMVNSPLETDLLYNIKKAAYQAEGFTTGTNDPQTLNTERVWYDKGAPNFGEGPNL